MKIKAAIFDLDGTLLDSMGMWQNFYYEYIAKNDLDMPEKIGEEFRTMSLDRAAHYIKEKTNLPKTEKQIYDETVAMIEEKYAITLQLKNGAYAFVEKLCKSGAKICIATASMRYLVEKVLKRTGLDQFISAIFTCAEVGAPKTEPKIFNQAVDFLGTKPEETWVFEDSLLAVKTAKSIGCKVAAVYDDSNTDSTEILKSLADVYIESFEDSLV